MPTTLILIRHALTDLSLEKRYCGFRDVGLNEKGKRQAKKLFKRLKQEEIHKVYTSDRKRAIQTAKIIFHGFKLERIPDLKEMHFGVFEGLTYQEIIKKYPKIYKKWLSNPFSMNIPDAEDLYNFIKRIVNALKKIIALNQNKTIAVVCHGGAIGVFITAILKSNHLLRYIPKPASLSIIEYKNGGGKIKLFNDTAHLNG